MLATTRDALSGWTAERLAATQTAVGAPSFLDYFDHGYPAAEEAGLRAFPASEIPFVFGTTDSPPAYWPAVPPTPPHHRLSRAMQGYWAAFIRDGAPRAEGEAPWRPYDDARTYMAFEDEPRLRAGPPPADALNEAVVCRRRAQGTLAWHWNVGVISPPLPPQAPECESALTVSDRGNAPFLRMGR
jgi:para-nitrobenzyl esterase